MQFNFKCTNQTTTQPNSPLTQHPTKRTTTTPHSQPPALSQSTGQVLCAAQLVTWFPQHGQSKHQDNLKVIMGFALGACRHVNTCYLKTLLCTPTKIQVHFPSVFVMPAPTLKLNSVVMKFLKPNPDVEEWESIVVGYEKVVDGPEVWFKIKYSSGWYSWCLG